MLGNLSMLVLPVLSCSLLLPPHGWTAPARRPLWAVCQAPTPDVSDGGGEQGDPRGPKPADHRRVKSASQASEAVGQHGQSAPSAAPWLGAPPSAGQPVSPSLGVRPPPRVLERSRRPFTASLAIQVDPISHLHLPYTSSVPLWPGRLVQLVAILLRGARQHGRPGGEALDPLVEEARHPAGG